MSDILIKGMEMPESCMLCPFCVEEADPANGEMCMVTGTLMPPCTRERLDNCPLVPVPPHGDLIERDKLREKEFIHDGDAYAVVMSRDIRNAPTIIEAEEGDT